jgi:enoyl-CoA hydratase/carnithine racemase
MTDQLIVSTSNGVGRLVLNQPDKLNAISLAMWQGLHSALVDFADDDAVRVVVVEGAVGEKPAFSAGADISEFADKRASKGAVDAYNALVQAAEHALAAIEKPTIAKIRGYCVGGGLAVALCCDLRIAAQGSRFGIPAAKLGLGYGVSALKPLVDLVGPSATKEILFTAKRFTAEEAQIMGLINRCVPAADLDAFVDDYANTIVGNAPLTIKAVKAIVQQTLRDEALRDETLCQHLVDACFASADYTEGRTAFMEKRKAKFTGR